MADLLLVTALCQSDIGLVYKRLDYLNGLGVPTKKHPIFLVNDGTLSESEFLKITEAHADSGLFGAIVTRTILDSPARQEWPWNVNHVWRTTAMMLGGQYGKPFDTSGYIGWFYFEPDVIPFNKDFATILEQHYLAAPVLQFMGGVNITRTSTGGSIRHMNGAAVYPVSAEFYYPKMMLADGLPWDVAGMGDEAISRRKDIPPEVYAMGFGTRDYKREGNTFTATQHLHDGTVQPYSFTLDKQLLHHGCKDGSLAECLTPRQSKKLDPATIANQHPVMVERIAEIKADKAAGMKWQKMLKKYKLPPAALKQALAA